MTASAGVVLYTSSADFNAALGAAPKGVEDYETYGLNSTIPDGTVLNGIRYDSFPAAKQGLIDNTWNKIGAQSLNLDRGDVLHNVFFDGDQLSISFTTPVRAFGFFFLRKPDADQQRPDGGHASRDRQHRRLYLRF